MHHTAMASVYRRLTAACLIVMLPALWFATVNAACVHESAAGAAHTHAVEHTHAHAGAGTAAAEPGPSPECPLHFDQVGCMVQAPLPVAATLEPVIPAAAAAVVVYLPEPLTADRSTIFRPPRA